jgi:signal transduction histidine kinase
MELVKIAIVGAGKGGSEFLKVLLGSPNVQIKYVCDVNPHAKGVLLAKQHGIPCVERFTEILKDNDLDLIFESTGKADVFEQLRQAKLSGVSLVGSGGTRLIFDLLDRYNEVNRNLQSSKINLERRIIERTEELEKLNSQLSQEKVTTEQLYEQQREINDEKSKYLIYTTHQLKAPFAAIQNYIDLILDGYTGGTNDETRDVVAKIRVRCELLSETIRQMLELAQLKAHVVDVVRENIDLREVVADVVARFNVAAASKSINIDIAQPKEPAICCTVRRQLSELLAVLMENAIKYSAPKQHVKISIGQDDEKYVISVTDHGIGIPKEHQERIFSEFFRANNAARAEPNGNGLGLAIAKEIAKLLGTAIEVESEIGRGSTFRVRIPDALH